MMMTIMIMITQLCYIVVAACGWSQFKSTSLPGPVTLRPTGAPTQDHWQTLVRLLADTSSPAVPVSGRSQAVNSGPVRPCTFCSDPLAL